MLCGGELKLKSEHAFGCQKCGQQIFQNNAAAADAVIVNDKNEILIAIRAAEPGKGKWDLPGGFVDVGETSEQALKRELAEELGFSIDQAKKVEYIRSGAGEYRWGKDTTFILTSTFLVRVQSGVKFEPHDDVADVKWVSLADFDDMKLFFAAHKKVIDNLKQKLL